MSPPTKNNWR